MRRFFTRKKIIWTIIILLAAGGIGYWQFKPKTNAANIQTTVVSQQKIKQTVLATGQVVSETNLSLSFQANGVVSKIPVATGNQVKAGDILASLDQAAAAASLTSANGQLAQANANYRRVVAGATSEQINVSQKSVDSAQVAYINAANQLMTVKNSTATAINQAQTTLEDLQSPITMSDNKRSAIVVTIANQLAAVKSNLDKEKQIIDDTNLKNVFGAADSSSVPSFKNANSQVQSLLDKANASLATAQAYKSDDNIYQAVLDALAVLNQDLISLNYCYIALQNTVAGSQFSQAQMDIYKTTISTAISSENSGITLIKSSRQALTDALTAAANALANAKLSATSQITSAQNTINSSKASLQQTEAALAQLKAPAQPADIDAARAQVLSAQGSVEAAQTNLNNTVIKAPVDGTVTLIDTKVSQQATAMKPVIILQNINILHAEAYISEANVASLRLGQPIEYSFDALGPDRLFNGQIISIDPASTVISGVVNYLIKASLPNIPEVKPGMTVNLTILVTSKDSAMAVTSSAIINENGKQYVRVIDNPKTKTYHQVEVTTGLQADGGLTEILSGLASGQEIVVLIKK